MLARQNITKFLNNAYACGKHYSPADNVEICRQNLEENFEKITIEEVKEALIQRNAEFEITKDKVIIKSFVLEKWR